MTTSPELRAEVIARMRELGAERAHTASEIANHGERRSTGMVWRALEELWEVRRVVPVGRDKYRLPDAGPDQMTMGGS